MWGGHPDPRMEAEDQPRDRVQHEGEDEGEDGHQQAGGAHRSSSLEKDCRADDRVGRGEEPGAVGEGPDSAGGEDPVAFGVRWDEVEGQRFAN